ncbi:MAG: hypothetical protein IJU79_00290 [Desulfovibrionaceae bacterium]|nr:hypothetical protein [Desulfovibrionaceae bacterium]
MLKICLLLSILLLAQPLKAAEFLPCAHCLQELPWAEIDAQIASQPQAQQLFLRQMISEHKARIQHIQQGIRQKLAALRALRYHSSAAPETLPTLGLELQTLRRELSKEYQTFAHNLQRELTPALTLNTEQCCRKGRRP